MIHIECTEMMFPALMVHARNLIANLEVWPKLRYPIDAEDTTHAHEQCS